MNYKEYIKTNKNLYNYEVQTYELNTIATLIANKSLKKLESKGYNIATDIIENKNYYKKDDYDDLKQAIIEKIILDNYIITKDTYKAVYRYLYNNNKDTYTTIKTKKAVEKIDEKTGELKTQYEDTYEKIYNVSLEKTLDDDDKSSILNYISYLSYNSSKIIINNTKKENAKNIINALKLTEKQRELLNIYSKTQSFEKTAQFLGISKQAINITIKRIKEKLIKLDIKIA